MRKWRLLGFSGLILLLLMIPFGVWVYHLNTTLKKRLQEGWFLPPLEFYSAGFKLEVGTTFDEAKLLAHLQRNQFRQRSENSFLQNKDFALLGRDKCRATLKSDFSEDVADCLLVRAKSGRWTLAGWNENHKILLIRDGKDLQPAVSADIAPQLIAQFYDGHPILKEPTELAKVPLSCLQAVTSIEDEEFLEHKGVSVTGTARAIVRNVLARRWAEGGSTITQQLVKNYFLSSRKTLKRKFTEQILAVLLEMQTNKDTILEQYLNVIYMGQSKNYQVRGFASAAEYYFGQPITNLDLPQCALLAALINNPGRYNPFRHPDHAKTRRQLVLTKMEERGLISQNEFDRANQAPLPQQEGRNDTVPAPYYLTTAQKELNDMGLLDESGLRVVTALDPFIQEAQVTAMDTQLPLAEKRVEQRTHQKPAHPLEGAMISIDLLTHKVVALVGGSDFRLTQFNRVTDSLRQIGSTIKPFVYYPALDRMDPMAPVEDIPFDYKIGRQVWSPHDYEKETFGIVPVFFALAESLNIPAAKVGLEIGLDKVVETLHAAGVDKDIAPNPSLALGAVELTPWQMAQIYSTLASMGSYKKISTIERVETLHGEVLYQNPSGFEQHLDKDKAAVVVGLLKMPPEIGTARSLQNWDIPLALAGKTGTTNDLKDAWFVGFTPRLLTVAWVGFDDNATTGLTGASGALPLWAKFEKTVASRFPSEDFAWPEGVELRTFSPDDIMAKYPSLRKFAHWPPQIQLVFRK